MIVMKMCESHNINDTAFRFFYLQGIYKSVPNLRLYQILNNDHKRITFNRRIRAGFYIPITNREDRL